MTVAVDTSTRFPVLSMPEDAPPGFKPVVAVKVPVVELTVPTPLSAPIVSLKVPRFRVLPVFRVTVAVSDNWLAASSLTTSVPEPSPTTRSPPTAVPVAEFRSSSPEVTVVVPV